MTKLLYNNQNHYKMARYKIQREFLFSNKSYDEISEFLKNYEDKIDLTKVRDNSGNTGLHNAAYNYNPDNMKLLKKYLEYMEKFYSKSYGNKQKFDPQESFESFVNSENKEGMTPLHFAAYKGNYRALEELCKAGADYKKNTKAGQNVLHLAAQGDKVETFIYFESLVDINCRDSKQSTPLHWASYMNSQAIVTYLLSHPNVDVNAKDQCNQTPLHLATAYGHTKIVKKLLKAGADRSIKSSTGQTALKIAQINEFRNIEKILTQDYGCLDHIKLYLNLKNIYKPQQRTIKKPIFFMFCFIVIAIIRHFLFIIDQSWSLLKWIDIGFDALLLLFYISLLIGAKPPKPQKYMDFLNGHVNLKRVCLACAAIKPSRSLHCDICKMCIQRYDHHCYWINNCVGKRNLKRFIAFLILFQLYLFEMILFSTMVLYNVFTHQNNMIYPKQDEGHELLQKIVAILYLILLDGFAIGFTIPMLALIGVQLKNILLNKTTYERFTKQNISTFTQSNSHLLSQQMQTKRQRRYTISNVLSMCRDDSTRDNEYINQSLATD